MPRRRGFYLALTDCTVQVVGTLPKDAVDAIVVPLINQIEVLPALSRHNRSLIPSPLKSPTSAIEDVVGTLPIPPAANTVVPFISQIDVSPAVSRQTMSVLPSPLKSPVPTMLQPEATLATNDLFWFNAAVRSSRPPTDQLPERALFRTVALGLLRSGP